MFAKGLGGLPLETTEADIAERFGWTFTQLDMEDQDRVYAGFALQNVRDSVNRIKTWFELVGKTHLSERDMRIYGMLMEAEKDVTGEIAKPLPSVQGLEMFLAEMKAEQPNG